MNIDRLTGNTQDLAIHLHQTRDLDQLHNSINQIHAPDGVCEKWNVDEEQYFSAVLAAYYEVLDDRGM